MAAEFPAYLVLVGALLTPGCYMFDTLINGQDVADIQSPAYSVVFDTGRGTGPYDQMTYAEFESVTSLVPETGLTVTSIKPDVWYCNGTCGYIAFIQDEHAQNLASQAGSWDGNGDMFSLPDRSLDSTLQLDVDSTYAVVLKVWTTKSIGIYTTGSRTSGVTGQAMFSTTFSTYEDRGSISFRLLRVE
ncbi:MAG TPA: hypothetical protein VJK02_20700 [Anaerolineales bacterium]|nr:hypothetical protein [Anaerolineales bacterium]